MESDGSKECELKVQTSLSKDIICKPDNIVIEEAFRADTMKESKIDCTTHEVAGEKNEKKRGREEEDPHSEDVEMICKVPKISEVEVCVGGEPGATVEPRVEDGTEDKNSSRVESHTLEKSTKDSGNDVEQVLPPQMASDGAIGAVKEVNDPVSTSIVEKDIIPTKRYKKRKIAMIVAYCGYGYQGMQRNPGAITIEGELEEALFRAGAIAESNFGDPRKVDWMRAARTDKGVSAVGQVVSGQFFIDPPGFIERVNSHLPKQICVLGYKRVIASFNAKKLCDRRRYEYVLPVYVFDPTMHLDRETSLANAAKEAGLQQAENSALAHSSGSATSVHDKSLIKDGIPLPTGNVSPAPEPMEAAIEFMKMVETVGETVLKDNEMGADQEEVVADVNVSSASKSEIKKSSDKPIVSQSEAVTTDGKIVSETASPSIVEVEDKALGKQVAEKSTFKFGESEFIRLNRVLKHFVGTHNFHNFTARTKAEDPSAHRYIISFEADDLFTVDGVEFVRCTVVGQSFMLHQIRKMIGLAVAVMRGCAPESIFDLALRRDTKLNVPMAPELGLFLEECYYSSYNSRFKSTHEEVSIADFTKEAKRFKNEFIYPHIASTELRDSTFALWLHSINDRHFPDFVAAREGKLKPGSRTAED